MYHIKDDKRIKKSAQLIVKAMDKCLAVHDFNDITITELCNVSTVGRATFYRLFDNLEDVVAYKCELFALEFSKDLIDCDMKTIQLKFFEKWMRNIEFLKLIISIKRVDILFDCHRNHIETICLAFNKSDIENEITDYHIAMLSNILISSLIVWCEHDCLESAEKIIKMTGSAIRDIEALFKNIN